MPIRRHVDTAAACMVVKVVSVNVFFVENVTQIVTV